jgi:pimeloyl-ACP methyl ester carboxylesterase
MKNKFIAILLLFTFVTYSQENNLNMKSELIESPKGIIEYTIQGSGKPILIIHGGNDNCFTDIKQQHLLEGNYKVIIPSRPGYGKTSISYGKTAAEQADFMKFLIDTLKIEKIAVIAHSAGGATALEFAKKYPQNCVCLILEDATTKTWVPKFTPKYFAMKYIFNPKRQHKLWERQRKEFNENRDKHIKRISKMFSTLKPEVIIKEWSEEDIVSYGEALKLMNSGEGFIHTLDHKAKDIHLIKVPCLISHSPFDKDVPFSHALYANKKIEGSELFVSPAKSHLIYQGKDFIYILEKRYSFLKANNW